MYFGAVKSLNTYVSLLDNTVKIMSFERSLS